MAGQLVRRASASVISCTATCSQPRVDALAQRCVFRLWVRPHSIARATAETSCSARMVRLDHEVAGPPPDSFHPELGAVVPAEHDNLRGTAGKATPQPAPMRAPAAASGPPKTPSPHLVNNCNKPCCKRSRWCDKRLRLHSNRIGRRGTGEVGAVVARCIVPTCTCNSRGNCSRSFRSWSWW